MEKKETDMKLTIEDCDALSAAYDYIMTAMERVDPNDPNGEENQKFYSEVRSRLMAIEKKARQELGRQKRKALQEGENK